MYHMYNLYLILLCDWAIITVSCWWVCANKRIWIFYFYVFTCDPSLAFSNSINNGGKLSTTFCQLFVCLEVSGMCFCYYRIFTAYIWTISIVLLSNKIHYVNFKQLFFFSWQHITVYNIFTTKQNAQHLVYKI